MPLSAEEVDIVKKSPEFAAMIAHPGWKMLVEAGQKALVDQWKYLLTVDPKDMERVRGFIEGVNFMLEYGDAAVHEARLIVERDQADRVADFEAERARQAAARERSQRRSRVGASLD